MSCSPPTGFPVILDHVSLILHGPRGPQYFLSVLSYGTLAHGGGDGVCSVWRDGMRRCWDGAVPPRHPIHQWERLLVGGWCFPPQPPVLLGP